MSRVDDALLRSGALPGEQSVKRREPSLEPFQSAWSGLKTEPKEPVAAIEAVKASSLVRDFASATMFDFNPAWSERLALPDKNPELRDQFGKLAGLLHRVQVTNGTKSVMVMSAMPGDGKTLTAMNLALVLSSSYGRKVLLIDADLRRASSHLLTRVGNAPGLNENLYSPREEKLPIVRLSNTLMFLPAGRPSTDPLRGLSSHRMRRILEEACECFDWVVVDAPPVAPVADVALLAEMIDTILFVVRAGHSQHGLVQKAIEALGGNQRILGVVLNAAEAPSDEYGYSYSYNKGASDPQGQSK
jgi:capsular exopolysaccharide synthesis family protein